MRFHSYFTIKRFLHDRRSSKIVPVCNECSAIKGANFALQFRSFSGILLQFFISEKWVNCRYIILIFVTLECCQYCFFCRRRLQCGLWTCCSAQCDLESSFCFLGMYIRHTVQQIRLPDVYPHSGDVGFPCSYVPKVCAVLWLGQSWDCYYDGKYNATYSQCHQGKARL